MITAQDANEAIIKFKSLVDSLSEHIPAHTIYLDQNGVPVPLRSTENNVMGVGNAMNKFRDGFVNGIDSLVWDKAWTNQADSLDVRGGDTAGSSYWKVSLSPLTANQEFELVSKGKFKLPSNFIAAVSMSQRILGQEVEVSLVGCDEDGIIDVGAAIADLAISGTVSITSNTATINFATAHNLHGGDRVLLKGNEERRLNVGPVLVTIISPTSITVPCTLANGTYNAGGFVEWADQVKRADNAVGVLFENATATNASWFARRNGASIRSVNSTVNTTVATQSNTSPYSDAFNAASHLELMANMREMLIVPRSADSVAASATPLKYTQGIPDEDKYYKLRVRAKNLSNLTRPVARIVSIEKTGTTTATVITDVPHGLLASSFIQTYGVCDIVNFPNLTAQTQVASIVDANTFKVVVGGPTVTTISAGGGVWEVNGSVLAPGVFAQNIQSISRTNNVLTVIGNTNWATPLPGETFSIYGCDATSMGLYDGAYKVLRVSTTTLELESNGSDFTSINCGGAVIRRTDVRIHFIHEMEYTRHVVELANQHGANDVSRALGMLILNNPSVVQSGTWNVGINAPLPAGTNAMGYVGLQFPFTVADVASAALTTTTTTAAITPSFGTAYQVNIPVTVFTATSLDVSIEESDDNGTNWFKVYDFPRITTTGIYRSPILRMRGTRIRYVQTFAGTTCTRAINRSQISHAASQIVQLIDRSIVPNTINSVTPWLLVEGCQDFNYKVRCTAQTGAATLTLQFSDNTTDVHTSTNTLTTVVGIAHGKVANEQWKFARLIVSAAGTGVTLGEVSIVGNGN